MFPLVSWALCLSALVPYLDASAHQGERMLDPNSQDETQSELGNSQDETQSELGNEPPAEFIRCNKAAWRIPDQYVVVLQEGTHESHVQQTIKRLHSRAARRGYLVMILQNYSGAFRGFLVKMSSDVLQLAARLPHVAHIEEDSSVFAQSIPWNLNRLLQAHTDNSSINASLLNDWGSAEIYLMDGSVQCSHREIKGHIHISDFNSVPEEDGVRVHRTANQCNSHGTHTAGVLSGWDSGVARGAQVNLVRVLNCQGKGTVSGTLAGLEYIRTAVLARPVASAVVLLPFIGGLSKSLNAACREMVSNGVVVVAAAGNFRDDACLYSPASEPEVITVGAVNSAEQPMSLGAGGTNTGRCVDLLAPGDDIVSASSDCDTCFTSRSGTSQAAAHAAGIAAVILSSSPETSPVQVLQKMLHYAVGGSMNLVSLTEARRLSTPNAMVAMPTATTGEELLCRSVWSDKSSRAGIRCRRGEEMMGCTSYVPDGVRMGEAIIHNGGQVECAAHSAPGGGGVYAVARCCVTGGLQCRVHSSPQPGLDAACANPNHHLTGCSSRSAAEGLPDSRPHHGNRKRCMVTEGISSNAVCCHAPSLECHLLEHTSTDSEQVEVSCPSGWTLTDCNVISRGSAIRGPVAKGNSCFVYSTAGVDGLTGIATCCRLHPTSPATDRLVPL